MNDVKIRCKALEALTLMRNLMESPEWQAFKEIVEDNDLARIKMETDKQLFQNLSEIPHDVMKEIAALRYRASVMTDMLEMPNTLALVFEKMAEEEAKEPEAEDDDERIY